VTTTFLSLSTAASELAEIWEGHAAAVKRYDPDDPKAKTLEKCASDLRSIAAKHAPEWVPIGVVQATSGIARTTLLRRCKELEVDGRARKRGERWELTIDAALDLARKGERMEIGQVNDMEELARLLGQEPER
jgi:hypothetical protein